MMVVGFLLLLVVYWDGVPSRCLVDTGATHSVIRSSVAAQVGTKSGPYATLLLKGFGGDIQGEVYRIPNVGTQALGWSYARPVVVPDSVMVNGYDCIIGVDLLGQQPVRMDFVLGTLEVAE